jgi:thiol-disulfide isomerase/thioredoxin
MKKFLIIGAVILLAIFAIIIGDAIKIVGVINEMNDNYENKLGQTLKSNKLIVRKINSNTKDTLKLNGITIINHWMYYCKPCIDEMPLLDSVAKHVGVKVALFTADTSQKTIELLNQNRVELDTYFYSDTSIFGNISIFPRTFILKDSTIVYDQTARLDMSKIELLHLLDSLKR